MGTRKDGFKKRTVVGKYLGYGIVGSYFGWTFEFRKHNVFCCSVNLLSTLLVKQPSEAHVPLFRPLSFVRVSLQAALSTHINSAMYSQKGCVVQDWLILQKRSYSGFHSWNLAPLHGFLSYDSLLHRKSKALPQKDYKRICPGCLKYATKNFLKSRRKLLLATQAKRSNFSEKRSLIDV